MLFADVKEAAPDPIFGVTSAFAADQRPNKVNLGVGVYRTADLKPGLLQVVHEAEVALAKENLPRPYMPIEGSCRYTELLSELLFGDSIKTLGGLACAQTVGATAALRVVGEFLVRQLGRREIFLPNPSWANHRAVFQSAGLQVQQYAYYARTTCGLAYQEMLDHIQQMPEGSPILLHTSCHNPTGVSPTVAQWKEIAEVVRERKLVPVFDTAYQGLGEGLEFDAQAIRLFAEAGIDLFVTYSCSKNFGLYGERVGALFVVTQNAHEADCVLSQVRTIIRSMYSNPPFHGQRVVDIVLGHEERRSKWLEELSGMRERIQEMRKGLLAALNARATGRDFAFLGQQQGLFSFMGLQQDQVLRLQNDYGIYTPPSGRINVTGLNSSNLDYVADAIAAVL